MSDIGALIQGFAAFKEKYEVDSDGYYRGLKEYGPHSKILMVACCDSRVDPAIITNSAAGDLMVIRNIANLVPPYSPEGRHLETSAALEFGVCYLNVEHIIIMGHSRCGGIRSLLTRLIDNTDPYHPLDEWTSVAEPAARSVLKAQPFDDIDTQACNCSRKALVASLENLLSYPWIRQRKERGVLKTHGWYFNLADGDLQEYQPHDGSFTTLLN